MAWFRRWIVPLLAAALAAAVSFQLGQEARWVSGRHWVMDPVAAGARGAIVVGIVAIALVVGARLTRRRPGSLAGHVALAIGIGAAGGFVVGSNVGPVYPTGDEYPAGTISLHLVVPDERRLAGPVTCTVAFERATPAGFVTSMRGMPLWGDDGEQLVLDVTFDEASAGGGADVSISQVDPWTELYRGRVEAGTLSGEDDRRSGTASFTAATVEGGAGSARGSFTWDCRPGAATPPSTPTLVPTAAPPLGGSLRLNGAIVGTFDVAAPACDIVDNPWLGAGVVEGSGTLADGRPARVRLTMGTGEDVPRPLLGVNLRLFVGADAEGVALVRDDGNPVYATLLPDLSLTLESSGAFAGLGRVTVSGSWGCLEGPTPVP